MKRAPIYTLVWVLLSPDYSYFVVIVINTFTQLISIKMSMFPPAKPPKTALGFRRILSPTAGIRVSPLCLGAMSLGEQWGGESLHQ